HPARPIRAAPRIQRCLALLCPIRLSNHHVGITRGRSDRSTQCAWLRDSPRFPHHAPVLPESARLPFLGMCLGDGGKWKPSTAVPDELHRLLPRVPHHSSPI